MLLFNFLGYFAILAVMKNVYELMLILKSPVEEKERERLMELIKKAVSPGKITDTKDWGKRILAYPIKKVKEGHYLLLTLELEGKEALKFPEVIKADEKLLRYLLVRKE